MNGNWDDSRAFNEIPAVEDYVLAKAASPVLGNIGFTIITVAALISTFSAINASLYGGSRVSYEIAEDDELPHALTSKLLNQPIGLLITAIATLVLVNVLKLESISTAGSIGFLSIFSVINFVGFKLAVKIQGKKLIPLVGFVMCSLALVVLVGQQYESNPTGVLVACTIILSCFLVELLYKKRNCS